jgi:hypothetical protein
MRDTLLSLERNRFNFIYSESAHVYPDEASQTPWGRPCMCRRFRTSTGIYISLYRVNSSCKTALRASRCYSLPSCSCFVRRYLTFCWLQQVILGTLVAVHVDRVWLCLWTAATEPMKTTAFWDVAPCSFVKYTDVPEVRIASNIRAMKAVRT